MPLQVIGAGLGRTGTSSLKAALERLGFPCYHMDELMMHPEHLEFWMEVADSNSNSNSNSNLTKEQEHKSSSDRHDWERVFGDFSAAIDAPAMCVYQELSKAYPEAKVILSVRDGGQWYDSAYPTIYQLQYSYPLRMRLLFLPWWKNFDRFISKMFWEGVMKGDMARGREAVANRVETWNKEVTDSIPPDRLLRYTVEEGWGPLCKFLDVDVPDEPFPRVNDTEAFKRGLLQQKRQGWGYFIGCLVVPALVSFSVVYIYRGKKMDLNFINNN